MIGAHYQQIAIRIESLQLRERLMLLIVSVVFLFFIVDSVALQPVFKRQQLLLEDIEAQEKQLDVLRARSSHIRFESAAEPAEPLQRLRNEISGFGYKLQTRLDEMLAPDKAASILEQVLTHGDSLNLGSVNTKYTPLTSVSEDNEQNVEIDDIRRYEMELQLQGSYLQTLNFLRSLESLPWKFFWSGIDFVVTEYPEAHVSINLYTLGRVDN
jgi:MSHA biogenesis protein MshJ